MRQRASVDQVARLGPRSGRRPLRLSGRLDRSARASWRDTFEGYAFALPFLVVYVVFLLYPFFKGLWISLHDWNLLAVAFNPDAKTFVGLKNYVDMLWGSGLIWDLGHQWPLRLAGLAAVALVLLLWRQGRLGRATALTLTVSGVALFAGALGIHPGADGSWHDRRFWGIVGNTLLFVLLTVPAITVLSLAFAMALNRRGPLAAALRTAFFLSQVLSVTVVTLIWKVMLSPRQGILANVMDSLGLARIEWVTDPALAMPAIVIATVWWSIGLAMILFIAGLQEIPGELYEAARIDGAGAWSVVRSITLPSLTRTITLVVVLQIILHFQVFGQSHLITCGGPNDSTQVLVRYIYQTAFRNSDLGYASALSVFLFAVMLVFSLLQMNLQRRG